MFSTKTKINEKEVHVVSTLNVIPDIVLKNDSIYGINVNEVNYGFGFSYHEAIIDFTRKHELLKNYDIIRQEQGRKFYVVAKKNTLPAYMSNINFASCINYKITTYDDVYIGIGVDLLKTVELYKEKFSSPQLNYRSYMHACCVSYEKTFPDQIFTVDNGKNYFSEYLDDMLYGYGKTHSEAVKNLEYKISLLTTHTVTYVNGRHTVKRNDSPKSPAGSSSNLIVAVEICNEEADKYKFAQFVNENILTIRILEGDYLVVKYCNFDYVYISDNIDTVKNIPFIGNGKTFEEAVKNLMSKVN